MVQRYRRLVAGSAYPENIAKYKEKLKYWEGKRVGQYDNAVEKDIKDFEKFTSDQIRLLELEFGKLKTNQIIVTSERLKHIKEHHPEDYELFLKNGSSAVNYPDYIIRDSKNSNTISIIKNVDNCNIDVVVKLILDSEKTEYKNSVLTFYRLRDNNLKKLKNKNKVLYKKE